MTGKSHSANYCASPIPHSKTLEDRLKLEAKNGTLSVSDTTVGSKQLTFTLKRVSRLLVSLLDPRAPAAECVGARACLPSTGRARQLPRVLVTGWALLVSGPRDPRAACGAEKAWPPGRGEGSGEASVAFRTEEGEDPWWQRRAAARSAVQRGRVPGSCPHGS